MSSAADDGGGTERRVTRCVGPFSIRLPPARGLGNVGARGSTLQRNGDAFVTIEPASTRASAIACAADWARRFGISAPAFRSTVESVVPLDPPMSSSAESLPGMSVVPGDADAAATIDRDAPHHLLRYRLATGAGTVFIRRDSSSGRDQADGDASPLRRRQRIVGLVVVAGGLATWMLPSAQIHQHPWFARHGGFLSLLVALACVTIALALALAEWSLGRSARRTPVVAGTFAAVLVAAIGAVVAWRLHQPSREHAAVLFRLGQDADALEEAAAVDAVAGVPDGSIAAVDALRLSRVGPDPSVADLTHLLEHPWRSDTARRQLRQRLEARARSDAAALIREARNADALRFVADSVAAFLPDERILWLSDAEAIDAPTACIRPDPDVGCFRRAMERAESGHASVALMHDAQDRFVAASEIWIATEFARAHVVCPAVMDPDRFDQIVSYATSIEYSFRVHLTFDSAGATAEAARLRAGCCRCGGGAHPHTNVVDFRQAQSTAASPGAPPVPIR